MGDHFGTQGAAGKGSDTDAAKWQKDNLGSTLVVVRLTIDPLVVVKLTIDPLVVIRLTVSG